MVLVVKEPACQCRRYKRCGFDPWVKKIPWRRKWQPTPVFYLENSMDRRDWQAIAHGVSKTLTWLQRLSTHSTVLYSADGWMLQKWAGLEAGESSVGSSRHAPDGHALAQDSVLSGFMWVCPYWLLIAFNLLVVFSFIFVHSTWEGLLDTWED